MMNFSLKYPTLIRRGSASTLIELGFWQMDGICAITLILVSGSPNQAHLSRIPMPYEPAIRHTLVLTHFAEVYRNYFKRPKLHTLHNRYGELWSPLVTLAAFFEEKGVVSGLLDAISHAAEWDVQVSQSKALSDREKAMLQTLEMMTRNTILILWNTVKNPAACKQVWKMYLEDVIFSFAPDTSEQAVPRWIKQAVRPDQPSFSLEQRDTYLCDRR